MLESWIETTVDGSVMRSLQVLPDAAADDGPVPGVVMAMHAPGLDEFMAHQARALAEAGIACVVPDVYHRQDMSRSATPIERLGMLDDEEVFRDLASAGSALRQHRAVAADRFGVIGFCMGGRIAWMQAAKDASLRAAVVFYGGMMNAAWTGERTADSASPAPTAMDLGHQIQCPLLGLYGADDTNPSPADMEAIRGLLSEGGQRIFELHAYEGCGHAFLNFLRPEMHRPEAAAAAWGRAVGWLQQHL